MKNFILQYWPFILVILVVLFLLPEVFNTLKKKKESSKAKAWDFDDLPKDTIFTVLSLKPMCVASISCENLSDESKEKFKGSDFDVSFKERTFLKLVVGGDRHLVKGNEVVWVK